ncbi:MAG: hypothetical protein J0H78_02195 [Rhizobiales bacterium]|nr:hypothetical protein [Hyphomicrobiales bacterium]
MFAMHAHHETTDTYVELFRKLKSLPREDRVVDLAEELVVGFPIVENEERDRFFVQVVEGDNSNPLVLNRDTGNTRENILNESELLSHATHLLFDPRNRRAVIEFVHRGAKAGVISSSIEELMRRNFSEYKSFRFSLSPIVQENFIAEINAFDRIREAALRVTRPNASWSDHYTDLSEFMEESDGDKVELNIKAQRGESLKKNRGIVKVIKDIVRDHQPYLDDAKITGVREDEENETTIHAKKHVLHTRVAVEADDAGVPKIGDVKEKLLRFLRGSVT